MRLLRHCPPGTHRQQTIDRARLHALEERVAKQIKYSMGKRKLRQFIDEVCGREL